MIDGPPSAHVEVVILRAVGYRWGHLRLIRQHAAAHCQCCVLYIPSHLRQRPCTSSPRAWVDRCEYSIPEFRIELELEFVPNRDANTWRSREDNQDFLHTASVQTLESSHLRVAVRPSAGIIVGVGCAQTLEVSHCQRIVEQVLHSCRSSPTHLQGIHRADGPSMICLSS